MWNAIDKEKASTYGLDQEQVSGQIDIQFTGQLATQYREAGQEMDVTLLYPENERASIGDLEDMKIQTPTGATIDLAEVATFNEMQGSVTLLREDQQHQRNVTSDIVERDLGETVAGEAAEVAEVALAGG